jgi:transcriptional regulator GlxA family with amidase domain
MEPKWIFSLRGVVRMSDAAVRAGYCMRHFERMFLEDVGMTPKMYARIARLQTALDAKLARSSLSWITIAHELGYHDQMHMVRDFHKLAGASPGNVLVSVGDGRPPAYLTNSNGDRMKSGIEEQFGCGI